MKKFEIVVTRHPSLVNYLEEMGLTNEDVQVLTHAGPDDVRGKNVCGVLPHSLSSLTASFTEVPLSIPAELRGTELTLEQIKKYANPAVTYIVRRA